MQDFSKLKQHFDRLTLKRFSTQMVTLTAATVVKVYLDYQCSLCEMPILTYNQKC